MYNLPVDKMWIKCVMPYGLTAIINPHPNLKIYISQTIVDKIRTFPQLSTAFSTDKSTVHFRQKYLIIEILSTLSTMLIMMIIKYLIKGGINEINY